MIKAFWLGLALLSLAVIPASASSITNPHVYTDGETVNAAILNSPLQVIYQWANGNIDSANIGPNGIWASQIKPGNIGQATFSGGVGYVFTSNNTSQTPLTVTLPTLSSAAALNVTTGGTSALSVSAAGQVNAPTFYSSALTGGTGFFNGLLTAGVGLSAGPASGAPASAGQVLMATDGTNATFRNQGTYTFYNYNGSGYGPIQAAAGTFAGDVTGSTVNGLSALEAGIGTGAAPSAGEMLIATDGNNALFRASGGYFFNNASGTASQPVTASAFNIGSDARLKRGIHPSRYGLAEIMHLRAYDYTLRSSGVKSVGLVAQQVRDVVPEAVSRGPAPGKYLSVNYSEIIPVLINAVHDQQRQIADLRAQLKARR